MLTIYYVINTYSTMEDKKRLAEERRRATARKTTKSDVYRRFNDVDLMFSTVRAIRTDWKQPDDWRKVTCHTLDQYVPPEREMTLNEILFYLRKHLDPLGPPPNRGPLSETLPVWHATDDQLITIVHGLLEQRAERSFNLPEASTSVDNIPGHEA